MGDKMTDKNDLGLMVSVNADQWAIIRRKLAFMEAVLSQVLADRLQVREWFTARELAALGLPGLGTSAAAIGQLAHHRSWASRTVRRDGRRVTVYHYCSLPQAAFESFIGKIVRAASADDATIRAASARNRQHKLSGAEPQWMLPLMRIIKGGAEDWQTAYARLQSALPPSCSMPRPEAVQSAFRRFARP